MQTESRNGVVGLILLGVGAGIAAAGCALLAPVCLGWSQKKFRQAIDKGKQGMISGLETAAATLKDVADKAQGPLSEAAKAARQTTAIAAGAVETAAHYVRERVQ